MNMSGDILNFYKGRTENTDLAFFRSDNKKIRWKESAYIVKFRWNMRIFAHEPNLWHS